MFVKPNLVSSIFISRHNLVGVLQLDCKESVDPLHLKFPENVLRSNMLENSAAFTS